LGKLWAAFNVPSLRRLNGAQNPPPQYCFCVGVSEPELASSGLFPLPYRSITMNELRTLDPLALDPFDDAFRSLMRPWRFDMPETAPRIKIDLSEQDGSYAVKAEIPGVKKDDIDVRVDGNTVTISAEVKSEKEEKGNGGRVLRRERQEGYASRTFSLACPVDESKVEASYKDGILALNLPKKADISSKRIAIQ
jgi:HSP20 family protein